MTPCPDCGAPRPVAEFIHGGVRMLCPDCGYFGPVCPTIQEAVADWDMMRVRSCGGEE